MHICVERICNLISHMLQYSTCSAIYQNIDRYLKKKKKKNTPCVTTFIELLIGIHFPTFTVPKH